MEKINIEDYGHQLIDAGEICITAATDADTAKYREPAGEDNRDVSLIAEDCAFIAHCRENASTLPYSDWFAMIGILAHGKNGEEIVHEYSKDYNNGRNHYTERETQQKFHEALQHDMPQTCRYIRELLGFECPAGGCYINDEPVTSPIQFAREVITADDFDDIEEMETESEAPEEGEATAEESEAKKKALKKAQKTIIINQTHALTDLGNARRFIDLTDGRAYWCADTQNWHVYDSKRWVETLSGGPIAEIKHKVLKLLTHQLKNIKDADVKECYAKHINSTQNIKGYNAMDSIAKNEPHMAKCLDDFDQNDYLLNVQNGIINLIDGALSDHNHLAMLSKISPVVYDDKADAPKFHQFMQDIFEGDADTIEFMQRWLGMQLTGDTKERKIAILYGNGSNGKSTLCNAISYVMGDYALTSDYEALMNSVNSSGSSANPAICEMQAKRFVITSEGKQEQKINSALIKQFTGSDRISTRQLYGRQFSFLPKCKINLLTNFKPDVSGLDGAIWDRLILIPFEASFPKDSPKRDKYMQDKLIAEAPGIFNWLLAGCIKWQQDGLQIPMKLLAAAKDYRSENDYVGLWMDEQCEIDSNAAIKQSDAWDHYSRWAIGDKDASAVSKKAFTAYVKLLGYTSNKNGAHNIKTFQGFKIKPSTPRKESPQWQTTD